MADPLSIAASIAGLITIADIVVRNGYKILKSIKDAEKTASILLAEVNTLSGILHSLHNVAMRYEDDNNPVPFDPAMKIYMIHDCYQTIAQMQAKLRIAVPEASTTAIRSLSQKLKWPYTEKETKKLFVEVEKHKSVLSIAVTADST